MTEAPANNVYAEVETALEHVLALFEREHRKSAHSDAEKYLLNLPRHFFDHGEYGLCACTVRDVYLEQKRTMPAELEDALSKAFSQMGMDFFDEP